MEQSDHESKPPAPMPLRVDPPRESLMKKILAPFVVVGAAVLKFLGPILKFLPILLKTGGTMLISIWFYAMNWGWRFAVGFVVLIFIHECGHLVVARWFGLKVGAPVFIPFMGALIALKEAPKNAWIEASVGIGGPIFGSLGAGACVLVYQATGNQLYLALAYSGFFLNLFNLTPIGFLDGGRIVTALSPWMWVAGLVILGWQTWLHPSFLLIMILVMSVPRLWSLFRAKTEEEKRFYEISPAQRWTMAVLYFGLAALLAIGMYETHIVPPGR
jgi:Zn-dependent protease